MSPFLFLLVSRVGCGFCLWLFLDFSVNPFDALSLVGPTDVQLWDFCCSSVSVLVMILSTYLSCFILVLNLDLHVRCFDALMMFMN